MPKNATDLRIAARIREAREYLELSVAELAQMLAIEEGELEAIESGDASVSAARLSDIAKTLGRNLEYFTGKVTAEAASARTEFLARAAETLSDQDMGELQRFADYLRSRSEDTAA
jgi:transcriptional regulator with XRE-family HTH domain